MNNKKYVDQNNPFIQFIENNLVKTDDKKNGVSLQDMWNEFKTEYYNDIKKYRVTKKKFESEIRKNMPANDFTTDTGNSCYTRFYNGFKNGWFLSSFIDKKLENDIDNFND